jgi:hypothetical protein
VSSLVLSKNKKNVLYSAGGDSFFLVWDYVEGKVLNKVDLSSHLGQDQINVQKLILQQDRLVIIFENLASVLVFDVSKEPKFLSRLDFESIVVDAVMTAQGLVAAHVPSDCMILETFEYNSKTQSFAKTSVKQSTMLPAATEDTLMPEFTLDYLAKIRKSYLQEKNFSKRAKKE